MNKLRITIIIILYSIKTSAGCCIGEEVGIFPNNKILNQNGIIVLTLPNSIGYNFNTLDSLHWKVKNQFGVIYNLEANIIKGGRQSQIVLKSKISFKRNDTLKLFFEYSQPPQDIIYENNQHRLHRDNIIYPRISEKQLINLLNVINTQYWIVNNIKDNCNPIWLSKEITNLTHDYSMSSVHGYSITFGLKTTDKIHKFDNNYDTTSVRIYEITYNDQKTILTGMNNLNLGFSICGSPLYFGLDTKCNFKIKLMDLSGNEASEIIETKVITNTNRNIPRKIENGE